MNDDGLRRWLEIADRPQRPVDRFADSLLDDLHHELGFSGTVPSDHATDVSIRRRYRSRPTRRRQLRLLLIAALVVTASGGLIAVGGALRDRLVSPSPISLLSEIRRAGRVRIAIRPDHPQFTVGGQTAAGFDTDVAMEIGRRLGVTTDIVIEDELAMVAQVDRDSWDIALPSVPIWTIDSTIFMTSTPYYHWPHQLVVPSTSTATTAPDVAAGPICAVAGDAGESWLRGNYAGSSATLVATSVVTRPTDDDCLTALSSGTVVAAVTAHLSAADVQVHAELRVIGGPEPEPRAMIVSSRQVTGVEPADLLRAVDDALGDMRTDGTLTRLSQARFGGLDLTAP